MIRSLITLCLICLLGGVLAAEDSIRQHHVTEGSTLSGTIGSGVEMVLLQVDEAGSYHFAITSQIIPLVVFYSTDGETLGSNFKGEALSPTVEMTLSAGPSIIVFDVLDDVDRGKAYGITMGTQPNIAPPAPEQSTSPPAEEQVDDPDLLKPGSKRAVTLSGETGAIGLMVPQAGRYQVRAKGAAALGAYMMLTVDGKEELGSNMHDGSLADVVQAELPEGLAVFLYAGFVDEHHGKTITVMFEAQPTAASQETSPALAQAVAEQAPVTPAVVTPAQLPPVAASAPERAVVPVQAAVALTGQTEVAWPSSPELEGPIRLQGGLQIGEKGHRYHVRRNADKQIAAAYDVESDALTRIERGADSIDIWNSDGSYERYRFNDTGMVLLTGAKDGPETRTIIDRDQQRIETQAPDGSSLVHTLGEDQLRITANNGVVWNASAGGAYERDAQKRITAVKDQAGRTWKFAYPGQDLLITAPDKTETKIHQDEATGERICEQDGLRTADMLDEQERLLQRRGPSGATINIGYTPQGWREAVLSADDIVFDHQLRIAPSDGGFSAYSSSHTGTWLFNRNDTGYERLDPLGQKTVWKTDAKGQPISVHDEAGVELAAWVRKDGKLQEARSPGCKLRFGYEAGRLSAISFGHTETVFVISRNEQGHIVGTLDTAGEGMGIEVNAQGQAETLVHERAGMFRLTWGEEGHVASIKRPDGSSTLIQRDHKQRPISITHTLADGSTLAYAVKRDARGYLRSIKEPEGTWTIDYAQGPFPSVVSRGNTTMNWKFDAWGQCTQLGPVRYVYGDTGFMSQLATDEGGVALATDGIGRITGLGGLKLEYDWQHRLSGGIMPNDNKIHIVWDALGRIASSDADGALKNYCYVGKQLCAVDKQRFVYAPGTDCLLAIISESGEVSYPLMDARGSVRHLMGADGTRTDRAILPEGQTEGGFELPLGPFGLLALGDGELLFDGEYSIFPMIRRPLAAQAPLPDMPEPRLGSPFVFAWWE
jgi:YD repeat-containing protein